MGAPEIAIQLKHIYSARGRRAFDYRFMGETCFRSAFEVEMVDSLEVNGSSVAENPLLSEIPGNRIGFDLGGSDRKCAAIMDGKVVFSEEVKWSPYFEADPEYHFAGILDSLKLAASHLPSVDAIGGSAAGIYIDNEPRVGSLFRGVSREDFDKHLRPVFRRLGEQFGNVPFEVANDGDVTALAGAMMVQDYPVLGIAMGTSLAAGYINEHGALTGWLNELAFVPVDYRSDAPVDDWSGDPGCGVPYFSQQAVGRLLETCGIALSADMPLPERLEWVQARMGEGDERMPPIYRTIGTYLGYTIPHFDEFYSLKHLLILGRVSSGMGGEIILEQARKVLDEEFPELSAKVKFQIPDETTKRHGQAIAAASLPSL
jgi:predicted NBD/HSP70 family sugar kinase